MEKEDKVINIEEIREKIAEVKRSMRPLTEFGSIKDLKPTDYAAVCNVKDFDPIINAMLYENNPESLASERELECHECHENICMSNLSYGQYLEMDVEKRPKLICSQCVIRKGLIKNVTGIVMRG